MPEIFQPTFQRSKKQEARRVASELFEQTPDWVTFFREILGVDGVVPRLFDTQEELAAFKRTQEYADIQQMVAQLRDQHGAPTTEEKEPTRVITVRMPKSLHESLRAEAYQRRTSMNKLCISKLLQVIDEGLVPTD